MKTDYFIGAIFFSIGVIFFSIGVILTFEVGKLAFEDWHETQAVRAALQGDCNTAYRESIRAGHVAYDAQQFCPILKGQP